MSIDDILGKVTDKSQQCMTTSKAFKRDVYDFFHKPYFEDKNVFEFGIFHGHTTIVLTQCFKHVYCFDNWPDAITAANAFLERNGVTNFTIFKQDLYDGTPLAVDEADVIVIDSKHTYDGVKADITRFLKVKAQGKKFFALDDWGICPEIRRCVQEYLDSNVLKLETYIGVKHGDGVSEREGIIVSEV